MNHIWLTEPITLLSDLGLAFLFLLAGYEINPKMLTGTEGKKGLRTWLVTFAFALALVFLHPNLAIGGIGVVPMAIVLVTTALGTLMPILRERELMNTKSAARSSHTAPGEKSARCSPWRCCSPRARTGRLQRFSPHS